MQMHSQMKRYIGWDPEQNSFCLHGFGGSVQVYSEVSWFPHLEALLNTSFRVFMEAPLHRHDWLEYSPLVIDSTSSPSLLSRNEGSTPLVMVGCAGILHHSQVLSSSHLIIINLAMVERGLLWIARCPFYFYGSEAISETEETKYNRCSHCSYCSGLWARNCGFRTNIYEKYILAIWVAKYIFLINHDIMSVFIEIRWTLLTSQFKKAFICYTINNKKYIKLFFKLRNVSLLPLLLRLFSFLFLKHVLLTC